MHGARFIRGRALATPARAKEVNSPDIAETALALLLLFSSRIHDPRQFARVHPDGGGKNAAQFSLYGVSALGNDKRGAMVARFRWVWRSLIASIVAYRKLLCFPLGGGL